jgi:5-methylcytosine-specific restriction endonuclease McrA
MYHEVSQQHINKEREKARELRKSRWWQNILSAGTTCYYCGRGIIRAEITMDHIVPVSQGGFSTKGNVVPCCKACNTMKRDMTAVEWQLHLESLRK